MKEHQTTGNKCLQIFQVQEDDVKQSLYKTNTKDLFDHDQVLSISWVGSQGRMFGNPGCLFPMRLRELTFSFCSTQKD